MKILYFDGMNAMWRAKINFGSSKSGVDDSFAHTGFLSKSAIILYLRFLICIHVPVEKIHSFVKHMVFDLQ